MIASRGLLAIAVAWLLVVSPLDLATTIARLLPRLFHQPSAALVCLTAARIGAAALGMAAGLSLARRTHSSTTLATAWAVVEVTTLAAVWVSGAVPTNRPPGLLLPTAAIYLGFAALVWAVARQQRRIAADARPSSLAHLPPRGRSR